MSRRIANAVRSDRKTTTTRSSLPCRHVCGSDKKKTSKKKDHTKLTKAVIQRLSYLFMSTSSQEVWEQYLVDDLVNRDAELVVLIHEHE
jgi:hypothetical protein